MIFQKSICYQFTNCLNVTMYLRTTLHKPLYCSLTNSFKITFSYWWYRIMCGDLQQVAESAPQQAPHASTDATLCTADYRAAGSIVPDI